MDLFQRIQQASQMNKLRYNNHSINRAGYVDLTLRLGMPNHDYHDDNPTEIFQSLNSSPFSPQQASLNYFNETYMSTIHDQPPMHFWQYGHNNVVSGDHTTGNNYYSNTFINTSTIGGAPNNNFGRFNQIGTNMGHIINTEADQVHVYSPPKNSSFNANIMDYNQYRSAYSSEASIQNNIQCHDNIGFRSRSGQSSQRNLNNRLKKQHSDIDHDNKAIMDVEEEVGVVEDHVLVDGDGDANKRCCNPNCQTQTTPMWRRGPLGPKSLCNACGIKYRKQQERAANMAAAKSAENTSSISNLSYH